MQQEEKPIARINKDDDAIFAPVCASIAALWQAGDKQQAINVLLGWMHVGGQDVLAYLERFVTLIEVDHDR
jgi:hypothetical protein